MKNLIIMILILSSSSIFGQHLSELNQTIGLTDSLTNEKEVRIYKDFGDQSHTQVFRMYQDSSKIWRAELINYKTRVPNPAKFNLHKQILIPKSEMDWIWLNIIKTNIQHLPNMSDIQWKLKEEPEIKEINGEKQLIRKITLMSGGEVFEVQIRLGDKSNRISYSNPDSYLRMYEGVDELIYFNELLNVVRTEFGVWENE